MTGVLIVTMVGCKAKVQSAESNTHAAPAQQGPAPAQTSTASHPQAQLSTSPSGSSTPGSAGPQYDWQQYDEESFETAPSQGRVFSIPGHAMKVRARVTASSPFDAAIMTRTVFKSGKGVVREENLYRLPCASIGVDHDDAKCSLNSKEEQVYILRDRRATLSAPVAALLAKKPGALRALAGNTTPNKIKVTLFVWACVANCGPLGGPAQ